MIRKIKKIWLKLACYFKAVIDEEARNIDSYCGQSF